MKLTQIGTRQQALELMQRLSYCHDASLRKICFAKPREVDEEDGALVYPFEKVEDRSLFEVQMEMILNSYSGAKKDQIVLLEFIGVREVRFRQDTHQDYSDIFDVKIDDNQDHPIKLTFYATDSKTDVLHLSCEQITCKEV